MEPVKLQILSWDKFNPRNDYKSIPWFRMDSNLPIDPKLHGMSVSDRWTWVVLLCIAGRENKNGIFEAQLSWIADQAKVDVNDVESALEKFKERKMIHVVTTVSRSRNGRHTTVSRSLRTNVRTYSTDETESASSPPSLAELWNELSGPLAKVQLSTFKPGRRWTAAKARLGEFPDLGYWRQVVTRIVSSPFCTGANDRKWKADFDWLIKPDTHAKVLEGKYDGQAKAAKDPYEGYTWA